MKTATTARQPCVDCYIKNSDKGRNMKANDYCKKCNAPHKPMMAVFMRCGRCAVINGKLPPTKYVPVKELKA